MFGVITTFKFKEPLSQPQIDLIREKVIEPMTLEPGFRHYFVVAAPSGEVGSFHAWDSREQAEAALTNMLPKLQPIIQDLLEGVPVRIMSEVTAEFHA